MVQHGLGGAGDHRGSGARDGLKKTFWAAREGLWFGVLRD